MKALQERIMRLKAKKDTAEALLKQAQEEQQEAEA